MPRIPVITPQSRVPTGSADFGNGGAANSVLGSISQGIGMAAREVQQYRDMQQRERQRLEHNEAVSFVYNTESQADIDWRERLVSEQNSGNAAGMTERVLTNFDTYAQERLQAAPNTTARDMLSQKFQVMRNRLHADSFRYEIGARTAAALQADDDGVEADSRALLGDPSRFDEVMERRTVGVLAMQLPDVQKNDRLKKVRSNLVLAAATGYAQQHPAETLAALGASVPNPSSAPARDGGTFSRAAVEESIKIMEAEAADPRYDQATRDATKREAERLRKQLDGMPGEAAPEPAKPAGPAHPALGMLPFERVDDIIRVAKTAMEGNVSSLRVTLTEKARDVQAAVSAGLPVGAKDVEGLREQYAAAYGPVEGQRRYHDEIGVPMLVGDQVSKLRSASPTERAAILEAAKVSSVDGASEQKVIYDAVVQASSIIARQLTEDPASYVAKSSPKVAQSLAAMDSATPENMAAAVSSYAVATLAEQERMGAPNPRILTAAQSDAIVKAFSDNPPERAADVIAGLEAQWGKHWPKVYGQLARDNKLTPAALVIPNMKDEGARARMAAASAIKPDELKTMIPPGDGKNLREKLQGYMEPAARTMMAQSVSGHQMVSTIFDQAEKLATVYRARGMDVDKSAKQAFDEVIGWRYEFSDTYRVPKEQQPEFVMKGAAYALQDLGRVAIFDSPHPMGAANRTRQSLDAIKTNGFWVTNEDESGLVLKVKGNDNNDYTAYRADGKRVEYRWNELRLLAQSVEPAAPLTPDERLTKQRDRLAEIDRMNRVRNGQR